MPPCSPPPPLRVRHSSILIPPSIAQAPPDPEGLAVAAWRPHCQPRRPWPPPPFPQKRSPSPPPCPALLESTSKPAEQYCQEAVTNLATAMGVEILSPFGSSVQMVTWKNMLYICEVPRLNTIPQVWAPSTSFLLSYIRSCTPLYAYNYNFPIRGCTS